MQLRWERITTCESTEREFDPRVGSNHWFLFVCLPIPDLNAEQITHNITIDLETYSRISYEKRHRYAFDEVKKESRTIDMPSVGIELWLFCVCFCLHSDSRIYCFFIAVSFRRVCESSLVPISAAIPSSHCYRSSEITTKSRTNWVLQPMTTSSHYNYTWVYLIFDTNEKLVIIICN